jgi:DNA-directed RNA polymerase subunit RPC12/RpoP
MKKYDYGIIRYWCEQCGAEPKIITGNEVKWCPCCGGYKTLNIYKDGE